IAEFADSPKSAMTVNRHVKYNAQRHQKDDRPRTADPRHFVLGWDNAAKKRLLAQHVAELEGELATIGEAIASLLAERERLEAVRQAALEATRVSDFDQIDVGRHEREIAALRQEQQELMQESDALQALS